MIRSFNINTKHFDASLTKSMHFADVFKVADHTKIPKICYEIDGVEIEVMGLDLLTCFSGD